MHIKLGSLCWGLVLDVHSTVPNADWTKKEAGSKTSGWFLSLAFTLSTIWLLHGFEHPLAFRAAAEWTSLLLAQLPQQVAHHSSSSPTQSASSSPVNKISFLFSNTYKFHR
jgi:hypothetical protein